MIATASLDPAPPQPVAPWRHTVLLAALFLGLALAGAVFQRQSAAGHGAPQGHPPVAPLYLSLIALEWGLFVYVRKGVRRSGTTTSELIGGRWASAKDVLVDVALALALWSVWRGLDAALARWLGPAAAAVVQPFLPRGAVEILLWVVLSISAGICEELVFRGYFQRQLAALAHGRWLALPLQAVLFGIGHGYQGPRACAKIALYGALLGALALWRRSLRPGMIVHAATDILGGLWGR
jgi:membrane protease YdiL (CAAX protease family)